MRDVDIKHGREVMTMKGQVAHVQKESRANVQKLVSDKKKLKIAMKEAAAQSNTVLQATRTKHNQDVAKLKVRVKSVRKSTKDASNKAAQEAQQRHKAMAAKLEREKDSLREHARKQRTGFKIILKENEDKQETLEMERNMLEVKTQKMARVIAAKQNTLGELEERLQLLDCTQDDLILKAKLEAEELQGALVAVTTGKAEHKTVEKRAKCAEKKVANVNLKLETLRETVRRHTQTINRLQEKLRAAAPVWTCLFFLKLAFGIIYYNIIKYYSMILLYVV